MEGNDNWIEKFKRISWEPEILISGGILFTLFQAQSGLVQVHNYLYPLQIRGTNAVLGLMALSISALNVGFILHLITKAFWIALLALKSVFPVGIKKEKLGYSETFLKRISIDLSIKSKISSVGNTSSLMFTISFLFLLIFLGIMNYLIFWGIIFKVSQSSFYVLYIALALLILPLIDFITFGSLKKSSAISAIYYPIYKFISWITLSFLYREILYAIFSNVSKKHILLFSFFFILASSLLTFRNIASSNYRSMAFHNWSFFDNTYANTIIERNYENLREQGDPVARATIQSDVVKDNYIKLYVRYRRMDFPLDSLATKYPDLSKNSLFNKFLDIKIDTTAIDSISWFYTRKMDLNQYGIIGYFPIDRIARGSHIIEIRTSQDEWIFTIPFWKE